MSDRQSIRPFLASLEDAGELLRIGKSVALKHELSAFLSAADSGPAVLFEKVVDSKLRIAGNLLNHRQRIADAIGCELGEIIPRIFDAIREPIAPRKVATASSQEVVITEKPLAGLPIPTFFEKETRPYITAGVIIARDPETGKGNASFARFAPLDDSRAFVGIAPNHHLALFSRKTAAMGKPLEIAVAIGAHPAIQLAACLYLGVGDDEMECAGRLLGEPVDVVPGRTVDLMVPADAEIVLEGRIEADKPVDEGFVSEYHGMYENYGPGILTTFSALTRRKDAIYQAIEPGYHREHIYLGGLPIAASLLRAIKAVVPNAVDVAVTEAGSGRTDIVVQLSEPRPGQARRAMFAAFAAVSIVKRVTVVDADIDPWDAIAVEWARINRSKAERDYLFVPHAGTDRSEPMEDGGLVTKIGIDATARMKDRVEGVERALPPKDVAEAARRWLIENIAPAGRKWLK